MSVDFPEPDGPMTAVSLPRGDVERDAAQRVDGGVALAEAAGQVVRGDDCGVAGGGRRALAYGKCSLRRSRDLLRRRSYCLTLRSAEQ